MTHSPFAAEQSIALVRTDAVPRNCRDSAVGPARYSCAAPRVREVSVLIGCPGIIRRRNHVEGTRIISSDKWAQVLALNAEWSARRGTFSWGCLAVTSRLDAKVAGH